MTGRLREVSAIITGAAGGIGSAAARAFVAEGAVVGLLDLPGPGLDRLAAELGASATALPADITQESQVAAAFASWWQERGSLTVLYACAGIQLHGEDGPADRTGLDVWDRTFAANATGTFLACKHAIPLVRRSGGGSVLICGSPTGLTMSGAGYSAYAASKGAVMSLARVMAADHVADGIRVNVIVPGPVRTPLIKELIDDEGTRSELERTTPIGRLAEPDDLVGIAVFLASPESAYATGATFAVDGGITSR